MTAIGLTILQTLGPFPEQGASFATISILPAGVFVIAGGRDRGTRWCFERTVESRGARCESQKRHIDGITDFSLGQLGSHRAVFGLHGRGTERRVLLTKWLKTE